MMTLPAFKPKSASTMAALSALMMLLLLPEAHSQWIFPEAEAQWVTHQYTPAVLHDIKQIHDLHTWMIQDFEELYDASVNALLKAHCIPEYILHHSVEPVQDSIAHLRLVMTETCNDESVPMHNISLSLDGEGHLVAEIMLSEKGEDLKFFQKFRIPSNVNITNISSSYTPEDVLDITFSLRHHLQRQIPVSILPKPKPTNPTPDTQKSSTTTSTSSSSSSNNNKAKKAAACWQRAAKKAMESRQVNHELAEKRQVKDDSTHTSEAITPSNAADKDQAQAAHPECLPLCDAGVETEVSPLSVATASVHQQDPYLSAEVSKPDGSDAEVMHNTAGILFSSTGQSSADSRTPSTVSSEEQRTPSDVPEGQKASSGQASNVDVRVKMLEEELRKLKELVSLSAQARSGRI